MASKTPPSGAQQPIQSADQSTKAWRTLGTRAIIDDRWLHLHADRVETEDGTILDPYYRINEPSWACVIAVTPDHRVVLVEQYRHGIGRLCLEFPAGDLDGDDPALAAARELHEETGYRTIGPLIELGALHTDPSRTNNTGFGFFAQVATEPDAQQTDAGEQVCVRLHPVEACLKAAGSGELSHASHVAFLYRALQRGLIRHSMS